MTREDNGKQNKTYIYNYDIYGNIKAKYEYAYTRVITVPPTGWNVWYEYTYDTAGTHKDVLTGVVIHNVNGITTYAMGSYDGLEEWTR